VGLRLDRVSAVGDVAHGHHVTLDEAVLAQVTVGGLDQDLAAVGAA
jgi:hypothetical protein